MKTAWFVFPAAVALAVACNEPNAPLDARTSRSSLGGISASSVSSNAVIHRVSVGGADVDAAAHTDANFSLLAVQKADGSVQGEWSDQFGQGQGGIHVDVNCLVVQGNQAWISGIVRQGSTGAGGVDLSGLPASTRISDNGRSANDTPDAISFSFLGGLAVPCAAQPNYPLFAMTNGQVTVN